MSKELEAIEWLETKCYVESPQYETFDKCINIIKPALQRLEAIENAEPSEVLKCVERIREFFLHRTREMSFQDLRDIEQALLKAEKDKEKIEKLKQENAILHIQLDTFEKIAFKKSMR